MVVVAAVVILMVAIVVFSHRKHIGTSKPTRIQKGDK